MSCYIKLNGWSGSDKENTMIQLAKVFRMQEYEADPILDHISQGKPWQFERSISIAQSGPAKILLAKLGFEVELTSETKKQKHYRLNEVSIR